MAREFRGVTCKPFQVTIFRAASAESPSGKYILYFETAVEAALCYTQERAKRQVDIAWRLELELRAEQSVSSELRVRNLQAEHVCVCNVHMPQQGLHLCL